MRRPKFRFFMCHPQQRMGRWYVRMYSTGRWPWYQAGVWYTKRPTREECLSQFKSFSEGIKR